MRSIHSFTDLYEWQKGHELVLQIYKLTQKFPNSELFGLVNQIRRAVISITSNIAEGFGRESKLEKIHFLYISIGSLAEVRNQLIAARDLKYLTVKDFEIIDALASEVHALIFGSIKRLKL